MPIHTCTDRHHQTGRIVEIGAIQFRCAAQVCEVMSGKEKRVGVNYDSSNDGGDGDNEGGADGDNGGSTGGNNDRDIGDNFNGHVKDSGK